MAGKDTSIMFRLSGTLKKRFQKCLRFEGIDQTTFLVSSIYNFVEKTEAKMEKEGWQEEKNNEEQDSE